MKRHLSTLCALVIGFALTAGVPSNTVRGDAGHGQGTADQKEMLEMTKKMHAGHEHGHDFKTMDDVSAEDMGRVMGLMMDIGLALPPMDSHRGRELFLEKGCVVCHAVNEVGGAVRPFARRGRYAPADERPRIRRQDVAGRPGYGADAAGLAGSGHRSQWARPGGPGGLRARRGRAARADSRADPGPLPRADTPEAGLALPPPAGRVFRQEFDLPVAGQVLRGQLHVAPAVASNSQLATSEPGRSAAPV